MVTGGYATNSRRRDIVPRYAVIMLLLLNCGGGGGGSLGLSVLLSGMMGVLLMVAL